MKLSYGISIFIIFLFAGNCDIFAQTYGKIIGKTEADSLFGKVLESRVLPDSLVAVVVADTSSHVMFHLKDSKLIIKGGGGHIIYPAGVELNGEESFTVYSKSVFDELVIRGADSAVIIQRRDEVLTISTDDITLEFGVGCPPYCD